MKEDNEEESAEKIRERSNRMINLFQAMKGKPFKDFPVPPFTKWLNGRIIDAKRGEIELEIDLRPEMANPTGILHGGMQAAIIDDIIGITSSTLGYEGFLIGIDLHIDYLGKIYVNEKIKALCRIVREGRHIVHVMAELKDQNGNLIATGDANLLRTHYKVDYLHKK
jgi:acyl-coenzyme A thioesterase 13